MNKIKVGEFNAMAVSEMKEFEFDGKTFEFRTFVPLAEKLNIVDEFSTLVFDEESGVKRSVIYDVMKVYFVMRSYVTNIIFPKKEKEDNVEAIYNSSVSSGLYDEVLLHVGDDAKVLFDMIDKNIKDNEDIYDKRNGFSAVVENMINHFSSDDMLKFLSAAEKTATLKQEMELEVIKDDEMDS